MSVSFDEQTGQAHRVAQEASRKRNSFVSEYFYLLRTNQKWWMLPLLALLLLLAGLFVMSGTPLAPLIYTVF